MNHRLNQALHGLVKSGNATFQIAFTLVLYSW